VAVETLGVRPVAAEPIRDWLRFAAGRPKPVTCGCENEGCWAGKAGVELGTEGGERRTMSVVMLGLSLTPVDEGAEVANVELDPLGSAFAALGGDAFSGKPRRIISLRTASGDGVTLGALDDVAVGVTMR
jgi:hypothetical protein